MITIVHVIGRLETDVVVVMMMTMMKIVLMDVSYLLETQIESSVYLLNDKQLVKEAKNPARRIDYSLERKQRKRVVDSSRQKIGNAKGNDIL